MNTAKFHGESINIQGNMYVFGGIDVTNDIFPYKPSVTGEYINLQNNTGPRPFIQMPEAIACHTVTQINESTSLIIGGWTNRTYNSKRTYYFNSYNNEWKIGPELLEGRLFHGAGVITDHDTCKKHVVVAGGINGWGWYLNSVELLNTEENTKWINGIFM